MNRLIK